MKLIIAGSRSIADRDRVDLWIDYIFMNRKERVSEVVSGLARGPDMFGIEWAKKYDIPVKEFPADWTKHGKAAGSIRNQAMADYADELLAFWDGKSNGTKNMITCMMLRNKPFQVILIR